MDEDEATLGSDTGYEHTTGDRSGNEDYDDHVGTDSTLCQSTDTVTVYEWE